MKILILILVVALSLFAKDTKLSMGTGSDGGTYYNIGKDIQKVMAKDGETLEVYKSAGSRHNFDMINGLGMDKKADFAMVQEDLLLYSQIEYKKKTKRALEDDFKVVFRLFSEELHLFKKKGSALKFPNSKKRYKIACGSKSSGSCMSTKILSLAYKQKFDYFHTSKLDALKLLKKGDVDFVLLVEGKPSSDFKNLNGFDLVNIPATKLLTSFYNPVTLTSKDYQWLTHNVKTLSVNSVILAAYNKKNPQNERVQALLKPILKNEKYLKSKGHPKWKEVSFTQNLKHGHPEAIRLLKAK